MINLSDGLVLFIAILAILLAGLVLYLIVLLTRVETVLWRVTRTLRPEVRRDHNGRRLYERLER